MIRLNGARKIEALLAGAVATTQPDVLVSYRDTVKTENAQFSTFTKPTAMNGVTPVTVCDGPVSGAMREVDFINVRNNDTASITVTLRVNDGGAVFTLRKVTLATLDQLCYSFVRGWYVVLASGGEKANVNSFGASYFNSPAPKVITIEGGGAGTNNVQLRFHGTNAGVDQWAIGNAVATNDASRNFDIFDIVAGLNRLRIDANGNFVIGYAAALVTSATDGFAHLPSCAGTPTGTPTTFTGKTPIVIDTSGSKFWAYIGGAWKSAALT